MLYYLFNYLDELNFPGAGMFHYISFRASLAIILSLTIGLIFGKKIIRMLQRQQIGEEIRDFSKAVLEDRAPKLSLEESLRNMRVLERILEKIRD